MADSIADDLLRSGYERWYRLEEEKSAIGEDLKGLFAELKGQGFTPKALRESFRRVRNIADADQQEHDAIVDLYVASLTGARPAHTRGASESTTQKTSNSGRYSAKSAAVITTPQHDAETGEITEQPSAEAHGAAGASSDSAAVESVSLTTDSQANAGGENVAASEGHETHRDNDLVDETPRADVVGISSAVETGATPFPAYDAPTALSSDVVPFKRPDQKPVHDLCLKLRPGCKLEGKGYGCAECQKIHASQKGSAA